MLATYACRDTQSQTICTTYATVASSCSTYHCALLGRGVRRFAQVVSVLCAYKERYSFGQDDFSQYHLPFDVQFIVIIFCFIFVVFLLFLFFFCYDLTMSYTLRLSCLDNGIHRRSVAKKNRSSWMSLNKILSVGIWSAFC